MLKVLHILFMAVGVVFFIWFSIPLFTHRILNIGNITGIIVSILFIAIGIFYKNILQLFHFLQESLLGKCITGIVLCFIGVIMITVITETYLIIKSSMKRPAQDATLVVLGCKVYGEHASRSLRERLEAARIYLNKNPEVMCIVSGGMGEGENISEAECMYRYLVAKGVDPSRIIKEEESTSTRENLRFSKKILEERGLGKNIAIATSEYHQYRASQIARKLGFSVGAVPGRTAWWLFPTFYVRELYGILYQAL